jgi:UDP-N-acetylglucosamine 1-carboxyvinyltransferase
MDKLIITGGLPLNGSIRISGAKNAALPLMCASILSFESLHLSNIPNLADIKTLLKVLAELGIGHKMSENTDGNRTIELKPEGVVNTTAPYDMVRTMRASILVLGPLLARYGRAKVSLPGGCAIGNRPIDLHIKGLQALGASIELEDGYVVAEAPNGLTGAHIRIPMVSVGATENILMAATLAKGTSTIENAAREPEITNLANCLVQMGASIEGIGTDTLTVHGVTELHEAKISVIADRIEAGSYAIAGALTKGTLKLTNIDPNIMAATIATLVEIGVNIKIGENTLTIADNEAPLKGIDIHTQPYPGLATDMQAQLMSLLVLSIGTSVITENIFENRFMHVPELSRMGADITTSGNVATIRGVRELNGAEVMATDLRASMSLVLGALAAKGETTIHRVYHLDRGYEKLEEKLNKVGATITRGQE